MSDTEKEKDVSCFSVDGVVAEMVIEVEENQKTGSDDFKVLSSSPEKDVHSGDKKDEDVISEEIIEMERKQTEKSDIEKKEDKENVMEIHEEKDDENLKEDKNVDKKNNHTLKSSRTLKRKKKSEITMNHSEDMSRSKDEDMPRYPGRKRLANKRYISEDMITSKTETSESVDSESNSKGMKKRKLEVDSKEKEEIKALANEKISKKSGQDKESNVSANEDPSTTKESVKKGKKKSEQNEDMEMEKPPPKQAVLRKLPFRKNRDAPEVPDLKPKVFWWNGVGEGKGIKLGDIPYIRDRIIEANSIRSLYRILFFQWPSNSRDVIFEQIFSFNGFPFDKTSYEFTKRQSIMKIMLDITIANMCEMLGLEKGDKPTMISNILNFLLKPYAKIDPAHDPSLQPVVVLERIMLDDSFFDQTSDDVKLRKGATTKRGFQNKKNNEKIVTPVRTTRGSSRVEIVDSVGIKKSAENSKEDLKTSKAKQSDSREAVHSTLKSASKNKASALKDVKTKTTPGVKDSKTKTTSAMVDNKIKTTSAMEDNKIKTTSTTKDVKAKTVSRSKDAKLSPKEEKSKTVEKSANMKQQISQPISKKLKRRKKVNKKINAINRKRNFVKESLDDGTKDDSDQFEIEMTIDSGPDVDDETKMKHVNNSKEAIQIEKGKDEESFQKRPKKVLVSTVNLSDSSETESAEETKLVTASKRSTKAPLKRKGKPLKHFPKISDSIQKANFSALQRLHILLFGASDKAENLKTNILAFGGFPFLEGSDEWKQKHFLLSLLAQNNLREYLNLLCIEYSDDDQPAMINKLMRFLAFPSEDSLENKIQPIETEVVSSELINKSPTPIPVKGKVESKKKVKKKDDNKKIPPRRRKVLMSEEEARRLEASFAREQRALARESRDSSFTVGPASSIPSLPMQPLNLKPKVLPVKPPVTDPRQLNALLQTVYKRRALKAAGAVISTPNKGEKIKLGDIENIKFLIVTSNLSDLDMLHRLIFMLEASKSRVRKNILDFEGFGFSEDSPKYRERMDFLNSLGYDASKRISFLLGLCPLQTDIPQQDLNELIMYFLMSPCKTKQVVPITEMPPFDEPLLDPMFYRSMSQTSVLSPPKSADGNNMAKTSTPVPKTVRQKARKSLSSNAKVSPAKKVLLPPSQSAALNVASLGNKPQKMTLLNAVPAVPTLSLSKSSIHNTTCNLTLVNTPGGIAVLNAPKSTVNSLVKVPVLGSPSTVQILNQGSGVALLDSAGKIPANTMPNIPGQILQNQIIIPQISNKVGLQPQQNITNASLLHGSKMLVKSSSGCALSPQEFLVQQKTPDGQQKTFKLVRLPPNHPLASAVSKSPGQLIFNKPLSQQAVSKSPDQQVVSKSPSQQTVSRPPSQQTVYTPTSQQTVSKVPLTETTSPAFKLQKSPDGWPTSSKVLRLPVDNVPFKANNSSSVKPASGIVEVDLDDDMASAGTSANSSNDNDLEILNTSESNPPTDDVLYSTIQEIILTSNFEDITLRNVIERVAAQFPDHDLTHRHNYMKDCVKKIIIGT